MQFITKCYIVRWNMINMNKNNRYIRTLEVLASSKIGCETIGH